MSAETLAQLRAGALHGAVRLDLAADLTAVPSEVLTLAESLEILNLSDNRLSDLPDWLPELKKLRVLFCSNNAFCSVPEIVGRCPALEMVGFKSCQISTLPAAALPPGLRWLILTDNQLTELPPELGGCARLQKLMLSGNRLTALPPELAQCRQLELLRLGANQFAAFPDWLWDLPALAWLGVGGNPCTEIQPPVDKDIPRSELTIGRLLGVGASGLIHQATWRNREVAVKFFKGAMTSDGLPATEMAISLRMGGDAPFIGAIGRVVGADGGVEGLVMPLIDPDYQSLAGPPSLNSCTRDEYDRDRRFSAAQTYRLFCALTAAGLQLRSRQMLHGDFYGHNVLCTRFGSAVLGDFGAASVYPPGPAEKMERIEVRAFGILLWEILDRCDEPGALPAGLLDLPGHCLQPEVAARPSFREIGDLMREWPQPLS
jgi:Leucine rich repeat/Leucine Rich repeats (2 copies)